MEPAAPGRSLGESKAETVNANIEKEKGACARHTIETGVPLDLITLWGSHRQTALFLRRDIPGLNTLGRD